LLALISLLLAAAPGNRAMLARVEAQEQLNDRLEAHFDSVCGALKSGQRQLAPALTDAAAYPQLKAIVWATGCSLRALKLEQVGATHAVHLLWEIEGRDATGARVTERGEADGTVRQEKSQWRLATFVEGTHAVVRRDTARFVEVATAAGLELPRNDVPSSQVELYSAGLTVRDVDGDGRPDVIAFQRNTAFLFRNQGPGLTFVREVLLEAPRGILITSAIAGDFDGDGDADLVVTAYANVPSWVLRNDDGRFVEAGRIPPGGFLHSGAATDFDGDGKLDLALLSYPVNATVPTDPLVSENGHPIVLLRGDGALGFSPWPVPKGVLTTRWSLAAMSVDLLGQGRPQLYVANDFGKKDLWQFEADGGLRNVAAERGLDDPGYGMSVDIGDLNGDGRLDVYLGNMFSKAGTRVLAGASGREDLMSQLNKFAQGNAMYLASADGGYVERGEQLAINRGLWAYASLMTDIDDDGRLEVAVANGFFSHPVRKDL